MKFWELCSFSRENPEVLDRIFSKEEWATFREWNNNFSKLCDTQDRKKLDFLLPNELCEDVLAELPGAMYISHGYLRMKPAGIDDIEMTNLEAFRKYGGSKIEDARENGMVRVY